jgi:hypothetical protein
VTMDRSPRPHRTPRWLCTLEVRGFISASFFFCCLAVVARVLHVCYGHMYCSALCWNSASLVAVQSTTIVLESRRC